MINPVPIQYIRISGGEDYASALDHLLFCGSLTIRLFLILRRAFDQQLIGHEFLDLRIVATDSDDTDRLLEVAGLGMRIDHRHNIAALALNIELPVALGVVDALAMQIAEDLHTARITLRLG